MKRIRLLVTALVLIICAAGCGSSAPQGGVSEREQLYLEIRERTPAPDIRLLDSEGREVALAPEDDRTLVVNLWASWCGYCVEEIPHFVRLAKEHPEVRVAMVNAVDSAGLAYSEEETANAYAAARALAIEGLCYVDHLGQAQQALGIRGVPLTLFIDGENNIRLRYPGMFSSYEELEEWLGYVQKYR